MQGRRTTGIRCSSPRAPWGHAADRGAPTMPAAAGRQKGATKKSEFERLWANCSPNTQSASCSRWWEQRLRRSCWPPLASARGVPAAGSAAKQPFVPHDGQDAQCLASPTRQQSGAPAAVAAGAAGAVDASISPHSHDESGHLHVGDRRAQANYRQRLHQRCSQVGQRHGPAQERGVVSSMRPHAQLSRMQIDLRARPVWTSALETKSCSPAKEHRVEDVGGDGEGMRRVVPGARVEGNHDLHLGESRLAGAAQVARVAAPSPARSRLALVLAARQPCHRRSLNRIACNS